MKSVVFSGKGAGIKGYDNANNVDIRIPYMLTIYC